MAARLTTYVVVAIVAATLIAGLIVGAQRDDSEGPVDLIVENAKVYTADASGAMAEAVAIRGNQILRVGSNREINRLRRPQTVVIDAKGGAVVPGFNDAHVHFIEGGLALQELDLSGALTSEDVQQRVRDWAAAHPDARWIIGRAGQEQPFSQGTPRQIIDDAVKDRPVQIVSADGGTAWVNTRALRVAGITRRTVDPPHGTIGRETRTAEPTGVLTGAAMSLVKNHLPAATRADRARALLAAIREAHRTGITSVQNAGGTAEDFELFDEARRAGDLQLRVYSALGIGPTFRDDDLTRIDGIVRRYPDDPVFKAGAVHIALDGGIESELAAMLEPYSSGEWTGEPLIAADDLNRIVRLLDARGWQVMIDASGDRAVRMALDALEHAVRSNPAPERGRRHRVEHIEAIDAADVPRFSAAGVVASMQPFAGSPTEAHTASWTHDLGPERASFGWAYRSIAGKRGHLAFGSDWPAAPLDPMLELHAAVNRTTPDGLPEDGWYPAERLPLKRAINASTSDAAWASFDEQRKGTLKAGMLADLVVLSNDIFTDPGARLASARVAVTIFDGKVVYTRDSKQYSH
jgi:predicted amidohydrolase YtcJ